MTECSSTGKALLSPQELHAADVTLGHEIISLPLFARLYRGAFKTGAGPDLPEWKQLSCRASYYALGALARFPQWGYICLDVQGRRRKIRFDCRNRQFNSLYFQKYAAGYEPTVAAALLGLLPHDGVLYDIGSNWGYFSLLIARRKEFRGHVHAFEPWPSSFADLSSIIQQAELNHIIAPHQVALAADSGEATMVSGRHSGLARLVSGGAGVRVTKKSIDELELEPPAFIKLDVEGFEPSVLRGGERTIRSAQPFVIFESSIGSPNPTTTEVLRLLEDWDYRLFIPTLTTTDDGQRSPLVTEAPKAGAVSLRLVLHPLTSRSRNLHRIFLNLLACPASRMSQIASLVENA